MQDGAGFSGQTGNQSPRRDSVSAPGVRHSAAESASRPPIGPALLNAKQAARLLGISERRFAELRHAAWFPAAIVLGPRALRWHRDELSAATLTCAPRAGVGAEPAHLAAAREAA